MKKSDFKFFFNEGQYFCSVKLPIDSKPICYMAMGNDNRPFDTIIDDIKLALEMLIDAYNGDMFIRDFVIARELPKLLGYKRATRFLTVKAS